MTFEFTKPDFASPPPVDVITPAVALTRGNIAGLYNTAQESFFSANSPADTRWATSINNPGATIAASNFAALTFDTWTNAYGGPGVLASSIVGSDAVVHLISDDIYLDLRFTAWTSGGGIGGGGFAYLRAVPEPATIALLLLGWPFAPRLNRRCR